MKKYRVFCTVESYSILPRDSKFEITYGFDNEEIRIRVENINSEDLIGREFSKKLSITTELESETIQDSISKCTAYVEILLDKIAFEVGMPVQNLKVIRAFEISESCETTEMVNFDYDVLSKIGSKTVEVNRLNEIISNTGNDRVERAMHWYRKALNEKDLFDVFSYLWISLETINPLLRDYFPDAIEISKCKSCGHERIIEGTAPLKEFFKTHLGSVELYSKARRIRQEIVHGYEDIATIYNKLIEIIDNLEKATRKAILYVSNLGENNQRYDMRIGNTESIVFLTYFKVSNFITNENDPNYFVPNIKVDIDLKHVNEELAIIPTITTDIFNHGCSLKGYGWDMTGSDPGYPVKKVQIKIVG